MSLQAKLAVPVPSEKLLSAVDVKAENQVGEELKPQNLCHKRPKCRDDEHAHLCRLGAEKLTSMREQDPGKEMHRISENMQLCQLREQPHDVQQNDVARCKKTDESQVQIRVSSQAGNISLSPENAERRNVFHMESAKQQHPICAKLKQIERGEPCSNFQPQNMPSDRILSCYESQESLKQTLHNKSDTEDANKAESCIKIVTDCKQPMSIPEDIHRNGIPVKRVEIAQQVPSEFLDTSRLQIDQSSMESMTQATTKSSGALSQIIFDEIDEILASDMRDNIQSSKLSMQDSADDFNDNDGWFGSENGEDNDRGALPFAECTPGNHDFVKRFIDSVKARAHADLDVPQDHFVDGSKEKCGKSRKNKAGPADIRNPVPSCCITGPLINKFGKTAFCQGCTVGGEEARHSTHCRRRFEMLVQEDALPSQTCPNEEVLPAADSDLFSLPVPQAQHASWAEAEVAAIVTEVQNLPVEDRRGAWKRKMLFYHPDKQQGGPPMKRSRNELTEVLAHVLHCTCSFQI
eukprot:gnl/MRDRNA2_/MRDRNA2_74841_c0_seq1.p1 gnl/MRDRNA2_/MRDRNA2_74841_c0~~gnl/MRDRNA2_/MRDRNA2_74841_c0_seq1.p1  ORF type:complete len:520 (+),score=93.98 gnl/MRDRNA2_/MRDRNA2_74841_c0_seq1:670-2229(+)